MIPAQYRRALDLDLALGDPDDPDNVLSFRNAVALDERDEYPEQACAELDRLEVHRQYVPARYGGSLRSFDELLITLCVVSRRDLAVAIEHAISFLGTTSIWLTGSESLRREAARVILQPSRVALGLTEKAHGGDLLSCEFRADKVNGGYQLSGEKWLINNGTRGAAITVFAKTDTRGDSVVFSLFFVEKAKLDQRSFEPLPPVRTYGIRGVDISGLRLSDAWIADDALIGKPGHGLEIVMKSLQVTRTMCSSLTLGAIDTALRTTVRFARFRRVFGSSVLDLPFPRSVLADAFADLLLCECVSIAASRALHVVPAQMSIISAAIKYFVPDIGDQAIRGLAVVLGARYYLREEHDHGIFQKILRDAAIVGLFDGSGVLNLSLINAQLSDLVESGTAGARRTGDELLAALRCCYDLAEPLPEFAPERLELHNRGAVDALDGIDLALAALEEIVSDGGSGAVAARECAKLVRVLTEERGHIAQQLKRISAAIPNRLTTLPETFELSRRYTAVYVGASCVQMWIHNRHTLGEFFTRGEWLALALRRIVGRFRPNELVSPCPFVDSIATELTERVVAGKPLSIVTPERQRAA